MSKEIWVLPFFAQGHLFPCMELCKQLASRHYKTTLVISSQLSSSIPSSFLHHPLVEVNEIPSPQGPPPEPGSDPGHHFHQPTQGLQELLSERSGSPGAGLLVCAIVDVMMSWAGDVFRRFDVPTISFFTSGACSSAMEYATSKAQPVDIGPGEIRLLPGLPEEMALTEADLKRRPHDPPGHGGGPPGPGAPFPGPQGAWGPHSPGSPVFGPPCASDPPGPRAAFPRPPNSWGPHSPGTRFPEPPGASNPPGPMAPFPGPPTASEHQNLVPPGPGHQFPAPPCNSGPPKPTDQPMWVKETAESIALIVNTCDDLERPFIDYLANKTGKPVWGVGPLLPENFWKSIGSLFHDRETRAGRRSSLSEDEVIAWLDSKTQKSVLYISFGSLVGPTVEELEVLADALEASNRPFIWVIQPGSGRPGPHGPPGSNGTDSEEEGYFPTGLDERVGDRGLIIRGWAPQLLILSHPSTGGFLSHCGWNSTVEAIGRGVPLLAWPIRGDQHYNAKLVVAYHKVGCMMSDDQSQMVKKDDIIRGIEKLLGDEDVKNRAARLRAIFENGFPASSVVALHAFEDLISQVRA